MVLTNAVYLKADWRFPFRVESTQPLPFYALGGARPVPTMSQVESFGYAAVDGNQLVELPYLGGELVMDVILPDARNGLGRLEAQLSKGKLPGWLRKLDGSQQRVALWLPKFHAKAQLSLVEKLAPLGGTLPFGPDADFTGFLPGKGVFFIGAVFHQAVIDVDEKGTEAAAATAIVAGTTSAMPPPPKPIEVRADHPFVYLVRDRLSGAILFYGRLVSP
jgi:serpin B